MIDEEDYQAFTWIKENVDSSYEKAILDPWKATAFTAITEREVLTRIGMYPRAIDERVYYVLQNGCKDPSFINFMKNADVSIIYTQWECHAPDFVEVRKNIYLLKKGKG